jgi:hypothetical protein
MKKISVVALVASFALLLPPVLARATASCAATSNLPIFTIFGGDNYSTARGHGVGTCSNIKTGHMEVEVCVEHATSYSGTYVVSSCMAAIDSDILTFLLDPNYTYSTETLRADAYSVCATGFVRTRTRVFDLGSLRATAFSDGLGCPVPSPLWE